MACHHQAHTDLLVIVGAGCGDVLLKG